MYQAGWVRAIQAICDNDKKDKHSKETVGHIPELEDVLCSIDGATVRLSRKPDTNVSFGGITWFQNIDSRQANDDELSYLEHSPSPNQRPLPGRGP